MRRIDVYIPIIGSVVIIVLVSIPLITQSVDNVPTYLAGLAAVVTSWISLYFSVVRQTLRRPNLKTEPDVETALFDKKEGKKTYLRLKITNTGKSVAKNCVGRLVQLVDEDGKSIRYDPLYFFWARQDDELVDFAPVNIYAGDSEYLDIAGIRHKEKIVKFRISSRKQPLPLGKVFPLKSYFVKVAIYGDDIVPLQEWYRIIVNKDAMQNSTLIKVKSPSQ
jgi:hypothetical protein